MTWASSKAHCLKILLSERGPTSIEKGHRGRLGLFIQVLEFVRSQNHPSVHAVSIKRAGATVGVGTKCKLTPEAKKLDGEKGREWKRRERNN